MPFELWGATDAPWIALPQRSLFGYGLLLAYGVALILLLYRQRARLARMTRRQWAGALFLSLLSLAVSRLFLVSIGFDSQLPPPSAAQNPEVTLALFGSVPFLLAAATLNPGAALIVGLFSGVGRALWGTHQLYDPFYFALVALFAASWMQQNYRGRIYRWLRSPLVTGPLSLVVTVPAVGLAALAYAGVGAGNLAALDWATSTTAAQALPFFAEGLIGGAIVALILFGIPQWRQRPTTLVPSPQGRSVRNRLLINFAIFAVLLSIGLFTVVFNLSVNVATQLALNQMAHDAEAVAERIPEFRNQVQNLLSQYGDDPVLLGDDEEAITERLRELTRTAGAYYRRVIVTDGDDDVVAFYPDRDADELSLTAQEQSAVAGALQRGVPAITAAQALEGREHVLSFIVPVVDEDGDPGAALIGRIPGIALSDLIVGLQGTVGSGSGFIVDEQNRVIAHPDQDSLLTMWLPSVAEGRSLTSKLDAPGVAYEGRKSETNARELVYYLQGPDHPWKIVLTVPYEIVLRLGLQISAPLAGVLALAMVSFAFILLYLGRSITSPLARLVEASQRLASGDWEANVPVEAEDEVGQLGRAFDQMRRSMQRQFRDMQLMVDVSQDISTSIDIHQGVPTILRGALRGSGASGVRAVVVNPSGRRPLTFAEGPVGDEMDVFDRKIARIAQRRRELMLSTPEQIRQELGLAPEQLLPVRSLLAIALYAKERFQGVFWLGYRQPHHFSATELDLLRTMAGQASVLVENARLFATAEGQRRRLAAVLASTSDAVIVTDQTDRVLLVNRAMEKTFNLRANQIVGRPVADVIHNANLVEALTKREERVRDLEVQVQPGRTLYASVSTIVSNENQVLGRVAVLHDITRLKELDDLKSEFVSTVSHDLRGPLTFMRGYITMLPIVGEINEKQQDYIDRILSGVKQMSGLVEDLLDLGRIEAGVDLMRDEIEAEKLLESVAREQAAQAAMQGIKFQVTAQPDLPSISGDLSLIRRAVVNLVSNAIKYAPDSGTVTLAAELDNEEVVFSVRDRGPGIPKKDQIRLFEKFYQVKGQEQNGNRRRGSGLGLAIVKSIVERHGGRVWVNSQVGRGSTFYFSLPVDRPSADGEHDDDE